MSRKYKNIRGQKTQEPAQPETWNMEPATNYVPYVPARITWSDGPMWFSSNLQPVTRNLKPC